MIGTATLLACGQPPLRPTWWSRREHEASRLVPPCEADDPDDVYAEALDALALSLLICWMAGR